jgi:hypothetical protein
MYTQESDGTDAGTTPAESASPADAIIADLFSQRCADMPRDAQRGLRAWRDRHYEDVLWALRNPEVFFEGRRKSAMTFRCCRSPSTRPIT